VRSGSTLPAHPCGDILRAPVGRRGARACAAEGAAPHSHACCPLGLGVAAFHQPRGSLVADGHADALEARYFLRPWGNVWYCVVLTERRLAAGRMQWGRLPVSQPRCAVRCFRARCIVARTIRCMSQRTDDNGSAKDPLLRAAPICYAANDELIESVSKISHLLPSRQLEKVEYRQSTPQYPRVPDRHLAVGCTTRAHCSRSGPPALHGSPTWTTSSACGRPRCSSCPCSGRCGSRTS
jgi:hypothetical protein